MTEAHWVEELGHPRLKYLSKSWSQGLNQFWQIPAAFFIGGGGIVALWLFGERIAWAVQTALCSITGR